MKKFLSVCLTAILAFGLIGCAAENVKREDADVEMTNRSDLADGIVVVTDLPELASKSILAWCEKYNAGASPTMQVIRPKIYALEDGNRVYAVQSENGLSFRVRVNNRGEVISSFPQDGSTAQLLHAINQVLVFANDKEFVPEDAKEFIRETQENINLIQLLIQQKAEQETSISAEMPDTKEIEEKMQEIQTEFEQLKEKLLSKQEESTEKEEQPTEISE